MDINQQLVSDLVRQQFPEFNELPIVPVNKQGWDNRTFRLGEAFSIRLPSNASYASAVHKEAKVLNALGKHLSVATPEIVALGKPSEAYPLPWSIRRWVPGATVEDTPTIDLPVFAKSLGQCLAELRAMPRENGPYAGRHSFYRGCHPSVYGDEIKESLRRLQGKVDADTCLAIWHRGTRTAWTKAPVWFHGDVATGNIIVDRDTVRAFIDFGLCGLGDPACDFVMAWTYFTGDNRKIFRSACSVDDDTWNRARAWALWKALVCLSGLSSPDTTGIQARALRELCNEDP